MVPSNSCHSLDCKCNVSASIFTWHFSFSMSSPLRRTPVIGFRAHSNPDLNLLLLQRLYFQIRSHSEFFLRYDFWGYTIKTTIESYGQNCDLESSRSLSINTEPTSKWIINIPLAVQRASWWANKASLFHNTWPAVCREVYKSRMTTHWNGFPRGEQYTFSKNICVFNTCSYFSGPFPGNP